MLEAVQKYRITTLTMVPPVVVLLVKSPLTKQYDLSKEVEKLWPSGRVKLHQGWGMTEGTCSLLGWDPRLDPHPDSVGELNANCHAKIVDPETLEEVKHGERGEIWVQAPNIMKGYWQKPAATQNNCIADVAVIGVTIEDGEVPELMLFKWLKGGVGFVEAIPKNPSGKILRKMLREKAKEEMSGDSVKARL
ncbi:hypothetical protein EYC84_002212 [Monilinia fructicola]|uniref:AMP-dependent synthetase/ligase domain-containing protein n=1 Tax=Monilinia fructicola TaxID=38448 RepID=A0A5M9JPE1_MONFR|nr:hypothetical protein EYC84_002212 [Monilinia fructicola]